MKSISKIILLIIIFLSILILFIERPTNSEEDFLRTELAKKGLPSPAFATKEELEKILSLK
jgi:hypothetical protein